MRTMLSYGGIGVGLGVLLSLRWDHALAVGMVAGGVWNLMNLWCLIRALHVWLGSESSRRQAVGWFLVKFPLLYLIAVGVLLARGVSAVGFGIGFSIVLAAALLTALRHAQQELRTLSSHGG